SFAPAADAPVLVHHPLHPFSPALFGVDAAFDAQGRVLHRAVEPIAHDARLLPAAAQMLREPRDLPSLIKGSVALPGDVDEVLEVTLEDLVAFYKNPSKGFLHRRLGIYLEDDERALEDREPPSIEAGLDSWGLRQRTLTQLLAGEDLESIYAQCRQAGRLPLGRPGRVTFDQWVGVVPDLVALATPLLEGGASERPLNLQLGGVRLVGRLDHLYPAGRVVVQASNTGPKHQVGLWLAHLVHRVVASHTPRPSYLLGIVNHEADLVTLGTAMPLAEATRCLETLLIYWRMGQHAPLSFFPETSKAYAHKLSKVSQKSKRTPEEQARAAAAKAWNKSNRATAESHNTYNLALYGDRRPFDRDFVWEGLDEALTVPFDAVAREFWDPFIAEEGP
ncbi:MAG: hypothetical protein QF464_18000, partial [Myxococcota bacterium]|nr:hypothetical protein [Myxococcota bacterium]